MFKSVGYKPFRTNYWPTMLNFGSTLICRPPNGQSCLVWLECAKKFRQERLKCEKFSDDDGLFVFIAGWDICMFLLFSSQFFPSFLNDWSLRSNNILTA